VQCHRGPRHGDLSEGVREQSVNDCLALHVGDTGKFTHQHSAGNLLLKFAGNRTPSSLPLGSRFLLKEIERVSSQVAGIQVAGIQVAGIQIAGVQVAGIQVAGIQVAGIQVAGIQVAGIQVAVIQVAVIQVAGIQVAGIQVAGIQVCQDGREGNRKERLKALQEPLVGTIQVGITQVGDSLKERFSKRVILLEK